MRDSYLKRKIDDDLLSWVRDDRRKPTPRRTACRLVWSKSIK